MTATFEDITAALVEQPHKEPPQFGLVRSSRVVIDGSDIDPVTGERWVNAVQFRPEDCDHGVALAVCGTDGVTEPTRGANVDPHRPFVIEANVQCSNFGNLSSEDRDRAARKLLAVQSFRLERELWAGTTATANGYTNNQFLAVPTATLIEGGSPFGTLAALAELEQYIAENALERGMIHAQPRTVIYWLNNGAVSERNGLIVTALGTIVVPGLGYPGTGPSGAQGATVSTTNADKTWAYATSLVYVRLGEIGYIDMRESLRATNRSAVIAYRFASANFSTCVLGAAYINHSAPERTMTGS